MPPNIGRVSGQKEMLSVEFTRPSNTTGYSAGDLLNASLTAPVPLEFGPLASENGGGGYITGARLQTDKKSITPQIRVHLFNIGDATLAHTTVGDNAPLKLLYTEASKWIGSFDLPAMTTPGDATNSTISQAVKSDFAKFFKCASGTRSIFAALEAIDAFTPASAQKFTLTLDAEID